MTRDEYAEIIANKLVGVDLDDGLAIIEDAQSVLEKSNLTREQERLFWESLQERCSSIVFVMEKQDSTAINAIILAIQTAVSNKAKQK